jgi:hypothetical protein
MDEGKSDRDNYEPPRVERVLTAGDLAREVQYAGDLPSLIMDDTLT